MMVEDSGVKRGEHQLLAYYLPGQIVAHVPRWSRGTTLLPVQSFITRVARLGQVIRISNAPNDPNRHDKVWMESEPRIKKTIKDLSGLSTSPDSAVRVVFYRIDCSRMTNFGVGLEIFPDTWEIDLSDNPRGKRLYSSNLNLSETERNTVRSISQAYIVLCSPFGFREPYIAQISVPNAVSWISSQDEPERRHLLHTDGTTEKIWPAGVERREDVEHGMKAKFPLERSNFIPRNFFDVYCPDMNRNSANMMVYFWRAEKVLNNEKRDLEKIESCAEDILRNKTNAGIIKYLIGENNTLFGGSEGDVLTKTLNFLNGDSQYMEHHKVEAVKGDATLNGPGVRQISDMFDTFYSENLQIGIFAMGYFSGKYYTPEDPQKPMLRRFAGGYNRYRNDYSIDERGGSEWPVFFQLFDTEGILITPGSKFYEQTIAKGYSPFESLHAVSHALMKCVPRYSGIEHGLVKEHFFMPESSSPAVLLYSTEPGRFRTKGLRFLFENNLEDLFFDAKTILDCPFSLLDTREGEMHDSGCGACTMMPNGCDYFNRKINRNGGLSILDCLH